MTSNTVTHRFVVSVVFLAVAGAVGAAAMLSSASSEAPGSSQSTTMSADMPGMGHGSAEVPASSPSPTMSADVPGMDQGSAGVPGENPEHGDAVEEAPDRPLAPVLGTFAGGTSALMLSAVFLRRKDHARSSAKEAVRAARRAQS